MIKILPPEEARKIAAGEVIDRPAALVREFMDNAIDAGGRLIEVLVEEGGVVKTEVLDDGEGMAMEDLELCWQTHATSKIRCLDDLQSAVSLGFRGEALAAAAAVSRLEILSSRDGTEAWKLSAGPAGKAPSLERSRRARGTSVRALGLYDTLPARKRFMKRSGSEAAACRQIFNEKSLAFPAIGFRFSQDGVLKCFLPPVDSLRERFAQIFLEEREAAFLHEIAASGRGFSLNIVAGGPELYRRDRRLQFVFANNRRIQDFALIQALEYGLQGFFPGGERPIGAVFVSIDPALADFNIHPAKREARFTDGAAIHQAITSALRNFTKTKTNTSHRGTEYTGGEKILDLNSSSVSFVPSYLRERSYINELAEAAVAAEPASAPYGKLRYLGRVFELFILVEKDEGLFIIDQHAAHERILYERFIRGPVPRQELLVPIPFVTESPEDDRFLEEKKEELAKLGLVLRREEKEWLIEALPSGWKLPDGETVAEILRLKEAGENLAERWATTLSCRAAVMDGDYLDEKTACELAEAAFALPVQRCPHGRPIWLQISRDDLFKAVKRN
ncbi:MAG: DNA mismatch repair endonuclease MutL [Treponema sp.]|nr:DNA mismatch repair endonuclease MutL [Treponema sp.]